MDIQKMTDHLQHFIEERGWGTYKTPKNIAMALSVEAAELLEIFQWMTPDESCKLSPDARRRVNEEIADVLSYVLQLAMALGIDLDQAFWDKAKKNEAKHPLVHS